MNRRQFLFTGLALTLSACSASNASPIKLATDVPTLLYFYTPN